MLQRLRETLAACPFYHPATDRLLLAVSGGLDSMVMAHLCLEAGLSIGVAHCNFQLRGAEADADEAFVREWANGRQVPFFSIRFDTQAVAAARGLSIQLAARELRYDWFEALRGQEGYAAIATAHHANDAIETFLYNFAKGTGLRGLTGIPTYQGHILRPLAQYSRAALAYYAQKHAVAYREDASNAERKYARNHLRLDVVPVLQDLNPKLEDTSLHTFQHLRDSLWLMQEAVAAWAAQHVRVHGARQLIDLPALRQHPAAHTILHECLRHAGFHAGQLQQVLASNSRTGALFHSPTHSLLIDRDTLVVHPRDTATQDSSNYISIPEGSHLIHAPDGHSISLRMGTGHPGEIGPDPNTALIDSAALAWPLHLRRWQPGDAFRPLGMGGRRQKLKDFFNNNKFSRFDKAEAWLLCTAHNDIIWLLGHRLDHRFRIKPDTEQYLALKIQKSDSSL